MSDIITTTACPHCGSGASWRRAMPTTGGRPVRLCTVCGRVSVDEDWTVPAGAEPARVLPSREEIAAALSAHRLRSASMTSDGGSKHACSCGSEWRAEKGEYGSWDRHHADAILALLAAQPTVAQVKAEAWDEGYDEGWTDSRTVNSGGPFPGADGNPYRLAPAQPTPGVFEAMGLPTPEVPNVGGEDR